MAIKEFREFFLRNEKVVTGLKKDQEVGFPTSYSVNINNTLKVVGNRFLDGNYPRQLVFEKLFESIPFKLNWEDSATESEQGLVSIATHSEVAKGTTIDDNNYQLAVSPKDVPYIYIVNNFPVTLGNYKLYDWFFVNNITSPDYYKFGQIDSISPFNISSFKVHPVPEGGLENTILTKESDANYDLAWKPLPTPKHRVLLLNQVGANDPTQKVLLNGLSTYPDIIWARSGAGEYTGVSTGLFDLDKTIILTQGAYSQDASNVIIVTIERIDNDTIKIITHDFATGAYIDDSLDNFSLKIEMY